MIQLGYGDRQYFRQHHDDINLLGRLVPNAEVRRAVYSLNDGEPISFYVEYDPPAGGPEYPWGTRTPSVHRLRNRPGWFNIEIPISAPELREGWNEVAIEITTAVDDVHTYQLQLHWDARPVELPLCLRDMSGVTNIQQIGQAVDGYFELDAARNVIRSQEPVGPDILFLLGSPHASQEATYDVKFAEGSRGSFLGLSDFFVMHSEQMPGLGIKPGYSTAGLATLNLHGRGAIWIAVGDCLTGKDWAWVVHTQRRPRIQLNTALHYSVRHQSVWHNGQTFARFRIWPRTENEPRGWLCAESTANLDPQLPRSSSASFGLFQYGGLPSEWSNINVRQLALSDAELADLYKPAMALTSRLRRLLWSLNLAGARRLARRVRRVLLRRS